MGLIAGIVERIAGAYSSEYVAQRLKSHALCQAADARTQNMALPQAGIQLLMATTQSAVNPPVMVATERHVLLSMGYYRHRTRHDLTDATIAQQMQRGIWLPTAQALLEFEGEFAIALLDRLSGAIDVVNDRFGARPMFLYQGKDAVAFSSDLAFLRHCCKTQLDLDPLGIFQLFTLEHTLGAQTTWRQVTKLLPATHLTLNAKQVVQRQYWQLTHEPREELNLQEHAQQTHAALRAGCAWREARFPQAAKALSLSGGLDSRLIAASLSNPSQFSAFTIGKPESAEMQVAQQVAAALQMRHIPLVLEDQMLSKTADQLALLTGWQLPLHHPATSLQLEHLVSQQHQVVFGGGPGDVLAGSYIPNAAYLFRHNVDAAMAVAGQIRCSDLPALAGLFQREVFEAFAPLCRQSISASLQEMRGPTAAHRISAWAMIQRQPAFTFMGPGVNSDALVDISPHLDYTYTDMMLQLTAAQLYHKNFYKFMMYRELPELRAIVYANTGELLSDGFDNPSPLTRLGDSLWTRLLLLVPPQKRAQIRQLHNQLQRRPAQLQAYSFFDFLVQDKVLLTTLKEILLDSPQLRQLLDVDGALAFVARCEARDVRDKAQATKWLGNLLTLAWSVK